MQLFKAMKNYYLIIIIALVFNSCLYYNRITSPEIINKKEHIWMLGGTIEPYEVLGKGMVSEDLWGIPLLYGFQPIIGYRRGIAINQEIGITFFCLTPGLVVDYKHKILKQGKVIISGDIAAFGGVERPKGLQYDLLFGNRSLYGNCGFYFDIDDYVPPSLVVSIGSEFKKNNPFGFQVSYSQSIITENKDDAYRSILIGLKYDLFKNKREYK